MFALQVGTEYATSARLILPWSGCWKLEVDFDREVSLSGRVTARLGDLELVGTVDPTKTGRVGALTSATIVGGLGWSTVLPALPLHSDTGVRRSRIAADVAALVGETVSVASALDGVVGVDWQRRRGPALRTLEQLFPDAWYVAEDGTTKAGDRPTRDVSGRLELIDADPTEQWIKVHAVDVRDVLPGLTLTDARLSSTVTIREAEVRTDGQKFVAILWVGAVEQSTGATMRRVVEKAIPWARYALLTRYRVLGMAGARVKLEAANKRQGWPDAIALDVAPGMAGLSAELTPGATVLVTFVDGDPALPIITHFERMGQTGFLPVSLALDASGTVRVGATAGSVELGGEAPISAAQALSERRFVRYGDPIQVSALNIPIAIAPAGGGVVNPTFSTVKP